MVNDPEVPSPGAVRRARIGTPQPSSLLLVMLNISIATTPAAAAAAASAAAAAAAAAAATNQSPARAPGAARRGAPKPALAARGGRQRAALAAAAACSPRADACPGARAAVRRRSWRWAGGWDGPRTDRHLRVGRARFSCAAARVDHPPLRSSSSVGSSKDDNRRMPRASRTYERRWTGAAGSDEVCPTGKRGQRRGTQSKLCLRVGPCGRLARGRLLTVAG
eukprot:scaffold3502_cov350-Prasinococcus_capsulatus_cf.AAC.1